MKKVKIICGGGFNRLHIGHEFFLKGARKLGDELVVMISHDNLNKKKLGKEAILASQRKKAVENLGIADKVLIGDPKDRMKIVREEKPDVIALGYDQKMPELENVKGIKIVRIGKMP